MNLDLLNEVYKLKDLIKSSDEYIALLAADKKLSKSEEASLLAYKKDLAICDYEDTLKHFNNKSVVALNFLLNLVETIIFKGL